MADGHANLAVQATRWGAIMRFCLGALMTGVLLGCALKPDSQPQDASAVGLLTMGTRSCTGILVDHDLVLTAAHCLYRRGQRLEPADFRFSLDPNHGGTQAIQELVKWGSALPKDKLSARDVPFDWAILRLRQPLMTVSPLRPYSWDAAQIRARLAAGARLYSAGYGAGGNRVLVDHGRCRFLTVDPFILTDCRVQEGDSGGPIALREPDGHLELLGIISGFTSDPATATPIAAGARVGRIL
ncbi:MAG TPA: serine protease [Dongiaceae bacterium]|jgi:V8-like Glu-specific endopeptidase|nr:serine protease [Dongiaceae bacterium]